MWCLWLSLSLDAVPKKCMHLLSAFGDVSFLFCRRSCRAAAEFLPPLIQRVLRACASFDKAVHRLRLAMRLMADDGDGLLQASLG